MTPNLPEQTCNHHKVNQLLGDYLTLLDMYEKKNDQKNESFEADKVFLKSNLPWRTSQINKIILLNRFFHYRHKKKIEMRLDWICKCVVHK